jgi:uncharacterized membrane protein
METKRRSILKALSWRFLATVITSLVVYFMTGKLTFALEIGGIDTFIKLGVYFAHERIWLMIPFGKIEERDYQI